MNPVFTYQWNGRALLSERPDLPFPKAVSVPDSCDPIWLFQRTPGSGRAALCPSDARQLTAEKEDLRFFSPDRLGPVPALPPELLQRVAERRLTAVNLQHPGWQRALEFVQPQPDRKKRVHLLAVGDVGGTLLTALKLLGSDCIHTIGICDLNEKTVARWVAEMSQVSLPWDYDSMPQVEAVSLEDLFHCDVFLFAASRSIPPVGSAVKDVRMAQFEANRAIVAQYARQARQEHFRGLFLVMSDPVDPLCKAAWLASNTNEDGTLDHAGLLPEQIQGLGLGVMNARAAALAKQNPAYAAFLTEGRSFGPHGNGLIIANSIAHYDDSISRALTQEVVEANLRIRELGFKPYVAPALSSGALQLLLLLRGQWHCGSVCTGGIWFGCRNRYTSFGLETEALVLPDQLYRRFEETGSILSAIL